MSAFGRMPAEAWALIMVVVVVALAGVAYLSLPEATSTVVPETKTDSRDLERPLEPVPSSSRPSPDAAPAATPAPSTVENAPDPGEPPRAGTFTSSSDERRSRATGETPETGTEARSVRGSSSSVEDRTEPPGSTPSRQPVSDPTIVSSAQPSTPAPSASTSEPDTSRGIATPVSARSTRSGAKQDAGAQPSVPLVTLEPSARNLLVGDFLSVRIVIDGASNVGHTPFHVLFNPAVLRFVSGTEGSFLAGDGQPTAFFASATSGGASVVVGLSRLGPVGGISGSGDLCVLQFEVIGTGTSGLVFQRAKVRDDTNRIVPAEFRSAAVNAS